MENNNEWMNDPELKNIDRAKLDFLNQMFVQSTTINSSGSQAERQKKMMAFLLSLGKLSKENNISFQNQEVELIFSVLKNTQPLMILLRCRKFLLFSVPSKD